MIDPGWYRDRRFAGASATIAVLALGSGSALFVLTQYLQLVRGTSAFLAGLGVMPLAVGAVLGSVLGGRAPAKIGARRTVVIGVLGMAAGYAMLATLVPASPYPMIGLGLFIVGSGLGFASPPASTLALAAIPAGRMGTGSALNTTRIWPRSWRTWRSAHCCRSCRRTALSPAWRTAGSGFSTNPQRRCSTRST